MVQIIPQAETFGGKLGTGLSEGFAQTFPKELERNRLASGLKAMKDFKGTEYERISELATQPGMTPQLMDALVPLLRQEANKRNRQKDMPLNERGQSGNPIQNGSMPDRQFTSPQGVQPQQDNRLSEEGMNMLSQINPSLASKIQSNQQQMPQVVPQGQSGLITPEAEFASRQPIYQATPEERLQYTYQLMDDYNLDFKTAKEEADKYFDTKYANEIEERNLKPLQGKQEDSIKTKFEGEFVRKLKLAEKEFPQMSGVLKDKLVKNALIDVASGDTENKAVEKWTNKASEVEKSITSLKNNIGSRGWIGPGSPKLMKDLETVRKVFEEVDALEDFKEYIMTNTDLGPKTASFIAFKPSKEKEQFYSSLNVNDSSEKIAAKIAKQMNSGESINAISYILSEKGIDADQVVDNLQKYSNDGMLKTSTLQDRELQEYTPTSKGLEDIAFRTFINPFAFLASEGTKFIAESLGASKPKESTYERVKKLLGKK